MNCFYHPHRTSVAQCVDCHKGLCHTCATKYSIPICNECNNSRKRQNILQFIKPIVFCSILFIIGYNLDIFGTDRTFGAYMLMCAYGGWKFINQFLPNIFVWFSIQAIFFFYLIKLCVSMFIGFFVTPFYLVYCAYKLIRIVVLK